MRPSETGKFRTALDDADDGKAAKRLMDLLPYQDGVCLESLAERYAIPGSTINH